jgi:LysM repeat protein
VQRQLEQLMEENKRLTEEVGKWQAYYTSRGAALRTNASVARPESVVQTASGPAATVQQPVQPNRQPDAGAAARTYRVQAGDTPSSVARKYNVKLDALMSANPGLDPRRMQVGQVLNLPAP